MTTPTDVTYTPSTTVISSAHMNGLNDWVYGAYGLLGETFTAANFRAALGSAASGANSDITSLAALTSINGTVTNDNAAAGKIGEYIISTNSSFTAGLTTGVGTNAHSIVLQPGDWDVQGILVWGTNATSITSFALLNSSISLTSINPNSINNSHVVPGGSASFNDSTYGTILKVTPTTRISISVATTIYLVGMSYFTAGAGTLNIKGTIRARRVR